MTKNLSRTLILTAAALTLGAGAAYAQDRMNAKIPFSFRITGTELPAGNYTVAPLASGSAMLFRNVETGKGAAVLVRNPASSANGAPRLVFTCGGGGCSLASLWFSADRGWEFRSEHREGTPGNDLRTPLERPVDAGQAVGTNAPGLAMVPACSCCCRAC